MGSLLSCDQCYTRETNSVITFSDALVLRITEGIELEDEKEGEELDLSHLPDHECFAKLRCIDDSHTAAYGLNMNAFDRLARRIERNLSQSSNMPCRHREIIDCYKKNQTCGLNCQYQASTFVDCIDLTRLKALKKQVNARKTASKVEDNDDDDY